MLCATCKEFDLDQVVSHNGLIHHESREALEACSSNDCEMCQAILNATPTARKINTFNRKWISDASPNTSELGPEQIVAQAYSDGIDYSAEGFTRVRFWQPKLQGKGSCFDNLVDVYVDEDDPISHLVPARKIADSSNTDEAFATAQYWLNTCKENHTLCRSSGNQLPSRIIDVGDVDKEPRLISAGGKRGSWAVLSHCWGPERHGITTLANLPERELQISLADIPQLYSDAIMLCRKIELKYLWIDSLCIIQDSISDWRIESLKMDQYFSGASVNISPSGASDSGMGIFSTADASRSHSMALAKVPYRSTKFNCKGMLNFRYILNRSYPTPLSQRAWVLQESRLSRRTLWYDIDQLRWECNTTYAYEEVPGFVEGRMNPRKVIYRLPVDYQPNLRGLVEVKQFDMSNEYPSEIALSWWYTILRTFVHRKITFPDDRLPAIAGLAKEFSKRTGFHYKAGIWEEDILRGLRWCGHGTKRETEFSTAPPSWSWACLAGDQLEPYEVCIGDYEDHLTYHDAEVVKIEVENEDSDVFGQVKSAALTLKGRWQYVNGDNTVPAPVFITREDHADADFRWRQGQHSVVCTMDGPPVGGHKGYSRNFIPPGTIYFQLGKWRRRRYPSILHALILAPAEGQGALYQRVGIAEVPDRQGEASLWPTKTITVV